MKTNLRAAVANALSFAHLSGITGKASAKAEDEKPNEDEKPKEGASAEDDKPPEDEKPKDGAGASAEDDKPKDDGEEKPKEGASAEDGDDDKDDEMHGKSAAASARRREQARCAAIFACRAAGRNVALAANLAFSTRMTRAEAIAVLEGTPGHNPASANRAAGNPNLGAGGERGGNSGHAAQASWANSFAKVRRT